MPDDSMVPVTDDLVARLRDRINGTGVWRTAGPDEDMQALAYRITTLERELAESQAHRDTAQSMVQAWVDVFGTIEAHIMDRVYMSDPANPALYLRIIRSGIANIQRSSAQICAARWADNRRQSDQITGLQAEVERLRGLVETAFRDGLSYGTDVWLQAVRRGA